MDAAGIVLGAICQGAVSAVSQGTTAGITSTYRKLRDLITGHRADPALGGRYEELVKAITALHDELKRNAGLFDSATVDAAREIAAKYHTEVNDSPGSVTGEHNTVTVNVNPPGRRGGRA